MVDPAAPPAPATQPSLAELLRAFAAISLSGFGGALPWARRQMVERRGWMSAEEFNEAFSLVQFLPGPNVVNFSVVFGSRFGGAPGALVAFIGLMGPPVLIVIVLAVLYAYYGGVDVLGRMLAGISAAAVGLLIATVVKMATPLFRRAELWACAVALVVFIAVGPLHWPLQWVLLVMAPASVAIAWMRQ